MDSRVPISQRTPMLDLAFAPASMGSRPALTRFAFQGAKASIMLIAECNALVASCPVGQRMPRSAISSRPGMDHQKES
jgi:hypothetical protein